MGNYGIRRFYGFAVSHLNPGLAFVIAVCRAKRDDLPAVVRALKGKGGSRRAGEENLAVTAQAMSQHRRTQSRHGSGQPGDHSGYMSCGVLGECVK
jgi:hypothetical protein